MFDAKIQLNVHISSLVSNFSRNIDSYYTNRHPKVSAWRLNFSTIRPSTGLTSTINFTESEGLTEKLFSELFFRYQLNKVMDLSVEQIEVRFGYGPGDLRQSPKAQHDIIITGSGRHSIIADDPAPFVTKRWTTHEVNLVLASIIDIAIQEPIE